LLPEMFLDQRRFLAGHVPLEKHLQREFAGFSAEGSQS